MNRAGCQESRDVDMKMYGLELASNRRTEITLGGDMNGPRQIAIKNN